MNGTNKMLMIFVDEADQWRNIPLYEALVDKLARMEVAGATVLAGITGYGTQGRIQKRRGPATNDRPVAVLAVDSEDKLNEVMPKLRPMVRDGLMMTLDVNVVPHSVGAVPVQ